LVVFLLMGIVFASGCAVTRSEVPSGVVKTESSTPDNGKQIVIRSVSDDRRFEDAPKVPSIPTMDVDRIAEVSDDLKLRAIGRKRNGFGRALGDVLLREGEGVDTVVATSLGNAFDALGYEVVEDSAASEQVIPVDISIKKMWCWIELGFASGTHSCEVETEATIVNGENVAKKLVLQTRIDESVMVVTESDWTERLQELAGKYTTISETKLKEAGM